MNRISPNATGAILTLNAGSSSLKFALFEATSNTAATVRGKIETLDDAPHMIARDGRGAVIAERRWPAPGPQTFATILEALLDFVARQVGSNELRAVGHRIVHGGADHIAAALISPELLSELESLVPLDPLHMPLNIAPIHAILASHPGLTQVACFDTAFHRTMPAVAQAFALPRDLTAHGVRRYGFHGLSFEYIAGRLRKLEPRLAHQRVVVAHLGSGASLCALNDGVSVATTTGFSTLDGLVMATRCGNLDPGVLLYLGRQGHSFDDIETILYKQSGLLGVSGISGDIRVLAASAEASAREAIDLFVYRLSCEVAAMTGALQGLDGLVFTAGIGEHDPAVRAAVCARLAWLGIELDVDANAAGAIRISTPTSAIAVLVIPTDEEAIIAQHTLAIIDEGAQRLPRTSDR